MKDGAAMGLQSFVVLALSAVPFTAHLFLPYGVPDDPNCKVGRYWDLALIAFFGYVVLRVTLKQFQASRGHFPWWPFDVVIAAYVVVLLVSAFAQTPSNNATVAKAMADQRSLMSAISLYRAREGHLPATVSDLAGVLPQAPRSWTAYEYETRKDGTFIIRTSGPVRCGQAIVSVVDGDMVRQ